MDIEINLDIAMDIDALLNGSFYPLRTFMTFEELDSVLNFLRLPNGQPWPIPILFPIQDDADIKKGRKIMLFFKKRFFASIVVRSIFQYDKKKFCGLNFKTLDRSHPGVIKTLNGPSRFITGNIARPVKLRDFLKIDALEPEEVRSRIKLNKWKKTVGFHTRNPPHRAHEFLQKCALQTHDGILIHPVIGSKKAGDFTSQAILKSYRAYIKNYLPKDRVILSPLLSYSRYSGPREALFTAIVRRNFGCTSFIVGRDHTGVGNFYGKFASQEIFKDFKDLGIDPIFFTGPYYCKRCSQVTTDKTCAHNKRDIEEISGSFIRDRLKKGKNIGPQIVRPEVLKELQKIKDPFV